MRQNSGRKKPELNTIRVLYSFPGSERKNLSAPYAATLPLPSQKTIPKLSAWIAFCDSLDVFSDDIKLKVYQVSDLQLVKISMLVCVRDDCNRKFSQTGIKAG